VVPGLQAKTSQDLFFSFIGFLAPYIIVRQILALSKAFADFLSNIGFVKGIRLFLVKYWFRQRDSLISAIISECH
jgi:hypothetical protein